MRTLVLLSLAASVWAASPPERLFLRVPFLAGEGDALRANELQAKLNGGPAALVRLWGAQDPLVLLVVLDLVGDLSVVDPARESLIGQLQQLPPHVSVALLRAQDGLRVLADPGTPRESLIEILRTLPITGRAGLLETAEPAARLADSMLWKTRVRTAVLFVSDSLISNYREDYTNPVVNSSDANDMSRRFPEGLVKEKLRQLREETASTMTPLFLVHLNYQRDRLNEAYQTGLLDLFTAAGGEAKFCRSVGEIPGAVAEVIGKTLRLQTAELETKAVRPKRWEIVLEAPGRELQYRSRYTPARTK